MEPNAAVGRANFFHLVAEIAWFGLALAALSRFMSMYAIRLGATPFELSMITAVPGLAMLLATSLAGWWRAKFTHTMDAVWLPAFGFRMLFFLPVFAPFFPPHLQVEWLIASIAIPAIPQGIVGVIFLVMMRESVETRIWNRLNGYRVLAMNIGIAIGSLAFGYLLKTIAFPTNYQVMFLIAFGLTIISLLHVLRIRALRPASGELALTPAPMPKPTTRLWTLPSFQTAAFVTLAAHVAFMSINSLLPLYVERMGADEGFLAVSGLVELMAGALVSLFADRIITRIGVRPFTTLAVTLLALAAFAMVAAPTLHFTLLASVLTGAGWSMTIIGALGFFYERVPQEHLQGGTTAYQQVVAVAQFAGPMIGAMLASSSLSLALVLVIGGALRLALAMLIQVDLFGPGRVAAPERAS